MMLILDVSAVVSVAFPDEDSTYADAVLDAIGNDRGVVPALFWFELRNVLIVGERRSRITQQQTAAILADFVLLSLEIDHQPMEVVVLDLARQHGLSVYDAAYLELARRRALPLATKDGALARAAPLAGVTVWQP